MTERTESELSEAYEKERATLADAQDELKAMQKHRIAILRTTGTPEDVLSLDDEIRLEGIKIEIANARMAPLKNELDIVRIERAKWTGVDMPSADELDKLLAIVTAARPDLNLAREQGRFDISERDHRAEFRRAFYAIGRMGRLAEPDAGRYFSSIFDDANSILRGRRLEEIEGDAFQSAALAWGDVVWRAADRDMGQSFEIGLARLNQGSPAVPRWRDILAGATNLQPPLPPRGMRASSSTYPSRPVRIYQEDADGVTRESPPIAPLLVQ
jgi:hypothetical protein